MASTISCLYHQHKLYFQRYSLCCYFCLHHHHHHHLLLYPQLFGLACLIVGIVFKVGWDDVREAFVNAASDVDVDLQAAGDILGYAGIVFGSFIIVVSLLGCIGACCRVRLLLVLVSSKLMI